jgi:hypothetical protein
MHINELNISVRCRNLLTGTLKLNTVDQVIEFTEQELLRQINFGRKSLNDLKYALEKVGLRLNDSVWSPDYSRSIKSAENRKKSLARAQGALEQYKRGYTFQEIGDMHSVTSARAIGLCQQAFEHHLRVINVVRLNYNNMGLEEAIRQELADPYDKKRQSLWDEIVKTSKDARRAKLMAR